MSLFRERRREEASSSVCSGLGSERNNRFLLFSPLSLPFSLSPFRALSSEEIKIPVSIPPPPRPFPPFFAAVVTDQQQSSLSLVRACVCSTFMIHSSSSSCSDGNHRLHRSLLSSPFLCAVNGTDARGDSPPPVGWFRGFAEFLSLSASNITLWRFLFCEKA